MKKIKVKDYYAIKRANARAKKLSEERRKEIAKKAIEAVEHFAFDVLGLKKTLTELNIGEEHFEDMAKHASMGAFIPGIKNLNQEDIVAIYKMCL